MPELSRRQYRRTEAELRERMRGYMDDRVGRPAVDYPLPSWWLRPLFTAAENHPALYRATVPVWWARCQWLRWVARPAVQHGNVHLGR